jgi:hypothetical protein
MGKHADYVRFNEFTDAICSVQLVAELAQSVKQRPLLWKWIIIGAHNALQGAMVCALSESDGTGALTTKSRIEMLDYLQNAREGVQPPREFLADYDTLFKCVQEAKRMIGGEPLCVSDLERKRLRKLNDLRRKLAHFTPKGWSIEAAGLPAIILAALDATEHLMLAQHRVVVHLTGNQTRALEHALNQARGDLTRIAGRNRKRQR